MIIRKISLSGNPAAECDIPNLQHFLHRAAPAVDFLFQLNVYFLKKRISILSFEDECCPSIGALL